jgi:hypothetical protein
LEKLVADFKLRDVKLVLKGNGGGYLQHAQDIKYTFHKLSECAAALTAAAAAAATTAAAVAAAKESVR